MQLDTDVNWCCDGCHTLLNTFLNTTSTVKLTTVPVWGSMTATHLTGPYGPARIVHEKHYKAWGMGHAYTLMQAYSVSEFHVPLYSELYTTVLYWFDVSQTRNKMSCWKISQITPVFQNGLLSALPYLAMWLFSMFISHVADWMISSNRFSITVTRKIINCIGKPTLHCTWYHNNEMMNQPFFLNYDLSFLNGTNLLLILILYCANQTLGLY